MHRFTTRSSVSPCSLLASSALRLNHLGSQSRTDSVSSESDIGAYAQLITETNLGCILTFTLRNIGLAAWCFFSFALQPSSATYLIATTTYYSSIGVFVLVLKLVLPLIWSPWQPWFKLPLFKSRVCTTARTSRPPTPGMMSCTTVTPAHVGSSSKTKSMTSPDSLPRSVLEKLSV